VLKKCGRRSVRYLCSAILILILGQISYSENPPSVNLLISGKRASAAGNYEIAEKDLRQAINEAGLRDGVRPLVFSTLVDQEISAVVVKAQALVLDCFQVFIAPMEAELKLQSSHAVGRSHSLANGSGYFRRIDAVNYAIGHFMGPKVFSQPDSRFLKREYLDRTHQFYEKYGGKTIIIARFVPIVRTFAPFVAGVGSMTYAKFASYNVVGGLLWVGVCVLAGYAFGNIPVVQENFTLVILGIIFVSILPGIIEFLRQRQQTVAE